MRLLAACSLGGAGHLNPLLSVLRVAARRGDDVLVVGPRALGHMVDSAGFAFRAGGEPSERQLAPIRDRLATAPAAEASVLGNRNLFGELATDALLPEMERAVAQFAPDLLLRETSEYSSAIAAAERDLPTAQVAISTAAVEAGSIRAAAPALEARFAGLVERLRAAPYLTRFPPAIDPDLFASTLRYREDLLGPSSQLPDWWRGSTDPLIYASLGSVVGRMPVAAGLYRVVIDALADVLADVRARVLLTVGRAFDQAALGSLPPNVHAEAWIDQADVLPAADLVLCHGGSGTVLGALAAGRPLVVVPVFGDQFPNGRGVQAVGAGRTVERDDGRPGPIDAASVSRLAEAVRAVYGTGAYTESARDVAAQMRTAPTAGQVLSALCGRAGLPGTR